MEQASTVPLGARVSYDLAQRVKDAADREQNPFAPSVTQIIVRGLELALQELEKRQKK